MADVRTFTPGSTSYWSAPEKALDPNLFTGMRIRPQVRTAILRLVHETLDRHFYGGTDWCTVWIAGSGASYQWAAARDPGDLDILIGVDYARFRRLNPDYMQISDTEISEVINDIFRTEVMPHTTNWQAP